MIISKKNKRKLRKLKKMILRRLVIDAIAMIPYIPMLVGFVFAGIGTYHGLYVPSPVDNYTKDFSIGIFLVVLSAVWACFWPYTRDELEDR